MTFSKEEQLQNEVFISLAERTHVQILRIFPDKAPLNWPDSLKRILQLLHSWVDDY